MRTKTHGRPAPWAASCAAPRQMPHPGADTCAAPRAGIPTRTHGDSAGAEACALGPAASCGRPDARCRPPPPTPGRAGALAIHAWLHWSPRGHGVNRLVHIAFPGWLFERPRAPVCLRVRGPRHPSMRGRQAGSSQVTVTGATVTVCADLPCGCIFLYNARWAIAPKPRDWWVPQVFTGTRSFSRLLT